MKKAAVDVAKAELQAATAAVRDVEAQARSEFFQLQNAIEDVDNRICSDSNCLVRAKSSCANLSVASFLLSAATRACKRASL